jgi:hypothetical protein
MYFLASSVTQVTGTEVGTAIFFVVRYTLFRNFFVVR